MRVFQALPFYIFIAILGVTNLNGQELICPRDTTIACDVLISPAFTGTAMTSGYDSLYFADVTIQSCPDDIIIERSWIATGDSIISDTCVQRITIEVDSLVALSLADTLVVQDQCITEVDEMIQMALDLPCNVGIDSLDATLVEETCSRSVINATWQLSDQCRDTSFTLSQVLILDNRQVTYLDESIVTVDTGSASGSISLIEICEPDNPVSYNWSNGASSMNLQSVEAGDYTVTITDEDGCEQVESFSIALMMTMDSTMMDTTGMVMDTTGMMMDTTGMMMDTTGMMMDTTGMMMDTTGMMMDTTGMMMDTTGMMMDTTGMMMDTTGMMMDTTGMMMDTTGMMMDTTVMMMDTTGMMMDTTVMMMDTTGMMMDTTGMMMDTTGMMMDTTGMMMDTTGMMMDTTSMMMDTTGMMMDTTGMMMDTTGMMMDTTGMMMDTTGMMMDTTGMMMDTTGMMMDTTGMMMDTTGMMMDTTGMMMDTTGMMMDTVMEVAIDTAGLDSVFTILINDRDGSLLSVDSIYFTSSNSGIVTFAQSESDSGMYSFVTNLDILTIEEVCIDKQDAPARDVSAQDIRIGQRIILQEIDGCIEDRIAGDVNGSNTFTAADLVSMRNVILQREDTFPINRTWTFVRENVTQLSAALCLPITNADKNAGQIQLTGLKLGDLKCNE